MPAAKCLPSRYFIRFMRYFHARALRFFFYQTMRFIFQASFARKKPPLLHRPDLHAFTAALFTSPPPCPSSLSEAYRCLISLEPSLSDNWDPPRAPSHAHCLFILAGTYLLSRCRALMWIFSLRIAYWAILYMLLARRHAIACSISDMFTISTFARYGH